MLRGTVQPCSFTHFSYSAAVISFASMQNGLVSTTLWGLSLGGRIDCPITNPPGPVRGT